MTANTSGSVPTERVAGARVVLVVYASVLAVAAVMGALLGYVNPDGLDPELFFLIDLPATPLGTATFGVVTVGVGLGLLLIGVRYVSRYDGGRLE
ncbi:MAG: cox cluster protein [Halosimplex sp.]